MLAVKPGDYVTGLCRSCLYAFTLNGLSLEVPRCRLRTVSVNCFSMAICLMSIRRYLPKRMIVACSVAVRIRGGWLASIHEVNSALRDDESNAVSSLDALRTCHQGERESVFILSSLLNGQPIIHIIGLNLITRPPEPYETMPSSCLQWWQMLAHGRQNNRRIWFPGHLHMHTMTAWAKGAWMDRRRENADPCSGEHHHGKASCEILNAFHAGSVMPPNTLLADDAIGTGTRPGIPLGIVRLARHPAPWWCCWHRL